MSLRSSNRYYAMPSELDLTPFGFTATESLAYAALLRLGPSTGYAVAHATRVARANTYGALEGLVTRTAARRRPTLPAWRRAKERAVLELRGAGDVPGEASPLLSGTVAGDSPTVLLIDEVQVVLVAGSGETTAGVWSSHPAITALARAWIQGLA